MTLNTENLRGRFREMHQHGCFVIPNPWDVGSAKTLAHLGFKAIATTSAGYAWSQGQSDTQLNLSTVLEHLRQMVKATHLPVNADFESGFAVGADQVNKNVALALETGISGLSIDDSTGDRHRPIRDIGDAVDRIQAAYAATSTTKAILVGRADNFLYGNPDLDDTIARLAAYSKAGADCLYAPGLQTRDQIMAVVQAVAPKPVNIVIGSAGNFDVQELAEMGVRRVSVGGSLARVAMGSFLEASRILAEQGKFDGLAGAMSGSELNKLFA